MHFRIPLFHSVEPTCFTMFFTFLYAFSLHFTGDTFYSHIYSDALNKIDALEFVTENYIKIYTN